MKLDELRKLAQAATPGPWHWGWRKGDKDAPGSIFSEHRSGIAIAIAMCPRYGREPFKNDAAYIAALSPERVLRMIAVIEAAKAMRSAYVQPMSPEGSAFDAALSALEEDV